MTDSLNKADATTLRELFYIEYSSILYFQIIFNKLFMRTFIHVW